MKPSLAWLTLILFWAAIYLPGLAGQELKGEEARRILPAVEMIRTGDWLVPRINGEPYLRKPPLINWLIAGSMRLTRSHGEWAARLPSVLSMLAMGAAVFATARRWMPLSGAWLAAIISISGIGLWEKGRLAEIEAVYVAFTGIALAFWLEARANRRTGLRLWLAPMLFLGLGLLTKGPFHLFFFYAVAIPALIASGEGRELIRWPHFVSLGLAGAIFAAWAVPYFQATAALASQAVWTEQVQQRFGGGDASFGNLAANFLRAAANGLPWAVFIPLWWNRRGLAALDERQAALLRAARWPVAIGFTALTVIPGMLPRYTLPLWPAAAFLFALTLPALGPVSQKAWAWVNRALLGIAVIGALAVPWIVRVPQRDWAGLIPVLLLGIAGAVAWRSPDHESVLRRAMGSAVIMAGAIGVYAAFILPKQGISNGLRQAGARIDAAAPGAAPLCVVNPGYQPILFYVTRPCAFVPSAREIPPGTGYVLMDKSDRKKAKKGLGGGMEIGTYGPKDKRQLVLVRFPN